MVTRQFGQPSSICVCGKRISTRYISKMSFAALLCEHRPHSGDRHGRTRRLGGAPVVWPDNRTRDGCVVWFIILWIQGGPPTIHTYVLQPMNTSRHCLRRVACIGPMVQRDRWHGQKWHLDVFKMYCSQVCARPMLFISLVHDGSNSP